MRRRQFILDSSMCMGDDRPAEAHADNGRVMCINGKPHDMTRIDEEVEVGTSEIWEIFSVGMAHPFHIHGASFRVLEIAGAPPPANVAGFWSPFTSPRRRDIPSCITATSPNTRRQE